MKMLKNYIISGEIELVTGLHIGGLKETLEIGGADSPVIRTYLVKEGDKLVKKVPYIPGSSLKGKIRALLEYADPNVEISSEKKNGFLKIGESFIKYPEDSVIPKIFGIPAEEEKEGFISRAIFRDAFPTDKTLKWWDEQIDLVEGAEIKTENSVNRLTSKANPRQFERVPPGSAFKFEIVLTVFEEDRSRELMETLLKGMKLLEENYLGGSGTRGYGKIKFKNIKVVKRTPEFYEGNEEEEKTVYEGKDYEFNIQQILTKIE